MKKYIITIILSIITINAFAGWNITHNAKDKLTGSPESYTNTYKDQYGDSFTTDSKLNTVWIYSDSSIFTYDESNYFTATIGFYEGDELVEKVTAKFMVGRDGYKDTAQLSSYYNPGLGEKIINHIKYNGSVRIIARTYSGRGYDVQIPMNNNIKWYK